MPHIGCMGTVKGIIIWIRRTVLYFQINAGLATMVLVLRSSQPVSDTDDQAYTSSDSLPVLPTLAAVERVYSLDAEM
jgi:hypothetical protein